VLDLGAMPLANAVLTEAGLGRPEPRHPLEVLFCPGCALVQIGTTVAPEDLFSHYAYFSSYATTAVECAESLAVSVIQRRGLGPGSLAMEVASNDGYLLRHYVAQGVPVLGIDPAANVVVAAEAAGVRTICGFFGPELAEELRASGRMADVLHANNVLAHVPDVNGFASAIGRVLVDRGDLALEQASMQGIKAWARRHPEQLNDLLNSNPSYVFFRELPAGLNGPLGALGVPLTAGRSIAIDPRHVPLGAPVFVATTWPNSPKPLNRLMLAQDTGGAIRGAVRADFFWGYGDAAGREAGRMKQALRMWVLLPHGYPVPGGVAHQ